MLIKILVACLFMALGAMSLLKYPGTVDIQWLGRHLTVDIITLLVAGVTTFLIFISLYKSFIFLSNMPKKYRDQCHNNQMDKTEKLYAEALTAFAAEDFKEVLSLGEKAMSYQKTPFAIFAAAVATQAAASLGMSEKVQLLSRDLMRHSSTKFLGLRYLIIDAQKNHRWDQAFDLLQEAYRLYPQSSWIMRNLLDYELRRNLLEKSNSLVDQLTLTQEMTTDESQRYKAIIFWKKAQNYLKNKDFDEYYNTVHKALEQAPDLYPATFSLAIYYKDSDRFVKALKILKKGYATLPLMAYLDVLESVQTGEPLIYFQQIQSVVDSHPHLDISFLILAHFALKAKLWGEAKNYLEQAKNRGGVCQEYYKILKDLEMSEQNVENGPLYLDLYTQLITNTAPRQSWVCSACHQSQTDWLDKCPICHRLDQMRLVSRTHLAPQKTLLPPSSYFDFFNK